MTTEHKLTHEQEKAYNDIVRFFDTSEVGHCLLQGSAGTGKTTVVKTIKNCYKDAFRIGVAAPTHKAKNVLMKVSGFTAGYTIAELLGLAPDTDIEDFNPTKPQFKSKNEPKLQYHKLFVIDESSMINDDLYYELLKQARQYGTRILFIGDAFQLAPVKQTAISAVFTETQQKIELKSIIRQKASNPISYLLLACRNDIHYQMYGGINSTIQSDLVAVLEEQAPHTIQTIVNNPGNTFAVLLQAIPTNYKNGTGYISVNDDAEMRSELVASYTSTSFDVDKTAVRTLAWQNKTVGAYNRGIRGLLKYDSIPFNREELLLGYKTQLDGRQTKLQNSSDYEVVSVATKYNNEDVHGYEATILELTAQQYSTIFVPSEQGVVKFRELHKQWMFLCFNDSRKWKDYYNWRNTYTLLEELKDVGGKYPATKDADFGYALTVHKSQGSTYETAIVIVRDIKQMLNYDASRKLEYLRCLYVAMSRASNKLILYV